MSTLGKFVFIGWTTGISPVTEVSFGSEDACRFAAAHWAKVNEGHAVCFTVKDVTQGLRTFASYWFEEQFGVLTT